MLWQAQVSPSWNLGAWREAARAALCAELPPADISWVDGPGDALLPAPDVRDAEPKRKPPNVPKALLDLAGSVLCHRADGRHALLYRLLWRLTHGEPHVLATPTDADLHRALRLAQEVRRDIHKMKAFVRFREVPGQADHFIAWFEPEHHILERVAPFFARRFVGMHWSILTPEMSAHWDRAHLSIGPGGKRTDAPSDDAGEALWRTYYAHIFNPARLNLKMMQQEMPQRYWKHLPEAALIPELARTAGKQVEAMIEREAQAPKRRIPKARMVEQPHAESLDGLAAAARMCRACPLWEPATQMVFGEGPRDAQAIIVGEQPGEREDLAGRPFVGPAGQLLDALFAEIGIERSALYLTNAVKHFRFERRGTRRLHRNPEPSHIAACKPWLQGELAHVNPQFVVALGATAARALMGPGFRLMVERGRWLALDDGREFLATVHPAWVLRQPEGPARVAATALLHQDLKMLAHRLNLNP